MQAVDGARKKYVVVHTVCGVFPQVSGMTGLKEIYCPQGSPQAVHKTRR
jgi:hypothetical protein